MPPLEHLPTYPHLLPPDVPVWDSFIDLNPFDVRDVEYDVRVGTGRDPGTSFPANIRMMALDLSKKRIDAVLHCRDGIYVVEVTKLAGLKALGQLLAYPQLYIATYSPSFSVSPWLVCQTLITDMLFLLDYYRIGYTLIPADQ